MTALEADHFGVVIGDEGTGRRKHQIRPPDSEAERQLLAQRQLIFRLLGPKFLFQLP